MEKWSNALIMAPIGRIYCLTYHVAMHLLCSESNVLLVFILVQPQAECWTFFGFV